MSFPSLAQEAFVSWLWLFGAPIRDLNMLWILVPIWVSWFFTEFFQEKRGTGFGNAITNGGVSIWVAIDWTRYLTNSLSGGEASMGASIYIKFALCAFLLIYGIIVIVKGLKRDKFASIGGRIRVITYILVMFTPIIYGTADINVMNMTAILVFFPIFYFVLEGVDRIVPDSKALATDKDIPDSKAESSAKPSDPFAKDAFGTQAPGEKPTQGIDNSQDNPFGPKKEPMGPMNNPQNPSPGPQRRPQPGFMPGQSAKQRPPGQQPPQRQGMPQGQQGMPQQQPQRQQYQEPDFERLPDRDKMKKNPFA